MPCIVCKHNQIKEIDRALLTGATLTSLSQKYGFTATALHRHQKHLMQKMAQARQGFHDSLRQGLFCKLNLVMEMVLGAVRGARAGEDFKLFLQASREFTRLIGLMIKMDVPLGPEMLYCLMSSPQWDLQDNLLPNAFQTLSSTRQTLKVNLFAACPEPKPDPVPVQPPTPEPQNSAPEPPDLISSLGTRNSKLEILPAKPGRTQEHAPKPEPDNWQLATGTCPKSQREISAKRTPKTSDMREYN
jgi:hypothetical protein